LAESEGFVVTRRRSSRVASGTESPSRVSVVTASPPNIASLVG
jgi:hypothetical protein